jgi:hypothetical protein
MSNSQSPSPRLLSFLNLSDAYVIRARLIPGVLSGMLLLPSAIALSIPLEKWLQSLLVGTGLSVVAAIGISHLASAMGNRFQRQLWSDWPNDAPTNQRLHPSDTTCSRQQKEIWWAKIQELTSLDPSLAEKEDPAELKRLINDAVTSIRTRLWKTGHSDRLQIQNADYGFARNYTGLRPVWLSLTTLGTALCWFCLLFGKADFNWTLVSTVFAIAAYLLAFFVLPNYVRQKADHYADSFFDSLMHLKSDEEDRK